MLAPLCSLAGCRLCLLLRNYRPVRLPTGPPALLSFSHSPQRDLSPVPCRTFSGAMLLPVWQLGLLWWTSELGECHGPLPPTAPVVASLRLPVVSPTASAAPPRSPLSLSVDTR